MMTRIFTCHETACPVIKGTTRVTDCQHLDKSQLTAVHVHLQTLGSLLG